ncbi:MAG: isoaspartyl peptidase/L-asparaginase [Pseudomonadota bacterium]
MERFAIAVHGGAVSKHGRDLKQQEESLRSIAATGGELVRAGAKAVDVVEELVVALEDSGLFCAGRGGAPNQVGEFELDASIMDGHSQACGAVAGLVGFANPITIAARVLSDTHHCFLVGDGAARFAKSIAAKPVVEPEKYFQPAVVAEENDGPLAHGTVGAICLDLAGNLAAGTSTAGTLKKMPGRVGDSPIIGSGTWADDHSAISCTGQGEFFVRLAAAKEMSMRINLGSESPSAAAASVLGRVADLGGEGGVICVTRDGAVHVDYNSAGLKFAALDSTGVMKSGVYGGANSNS